MKRAWEEQNPAGYSSSSGQVNDSPWLPMPSHPYASAYSSMQNPFGDSSFSSEDPYGNVFAPESGGKKQRQSLADEDGSQDDDEDGDEDDYDEDGVRRGKKEKPKAKLTRGSRCVRVGPLD